MFAQKLFRGALAIGRDRERELRPTRFRGLDGFNIRSAVQDSLKFRDEIQVVKDLVPFILPGGQGNRLRQKLSPTVGVIANPSRHARQKCDSRGLEGVLKQEREIEAAVAPLARLSPRRSQPRSIVNQKLIYEVCFDKNIRSGRTRNQGDVRGGQQAQTTAQG